jgi:LysR family transcriptional regulator, hydrogen peroxide-inducible genes activator
MINMHSLVQLEYIIAVDTYQQFSIAAEKCFVTQPTLSMQIKKLENNLDVVIFDRSKQPVVPTEIGKKIVEQARVIISESKKIEEIVQISKHTVSGELRIGIIPSVAPYLLPLFIGKLSKAYPHLSINIKELVTDDILLELDKETVDVGIVSTPLPKSGYNAVPIYYEKIFIYCHPSHPFYAKKDISLKELSVENIWLLSQGHCFRSQVINICALKDSGGQFPFTYESASIETLIKMVDKEGGLTLIPELAVQDLTPTKQKGVKLIHDMNPVREIGLITNRIFVKQSILNVLQKSLQAVLPNDLQKIERGERVDWQ